MEKNGRGLGDVLEREGIWGVLFCSISEQASFCAERHHAQESPCSISQKNASAKSHHHRLSQTPKMGKEYLLERIFVIFPLKS